MELQIKCSQCNANLKIGAQYAGKRVQCSKCKAIITVPAEGSGLEKKKLRKAKPLPATPASPAAAAPPDTPRPAASVPPAAAPAPPRDSNSSAAGMPETKIESKLTANAAATPAPTGIALDTAPKSMTSTRRVKRKKNSSVGLLIVGGGGVAVLAALVVGILLYSNSAQSGSGGQGGGSGSAGSAELVLDWKEGDRGDAALLIDGKRVPVQPTGELRYPLSSGNHRVILQRRGFDQVEVVVSLKQGDTHTFAPDWQRSFAAATPTPTPHTNFTAPTPVANPPAAIGPAGFINWGQNFDRAQRDAKASGKDILLMFAGSDWEPTTQRLTNGVFSSYDYMQQLRQEFELVVLDFPRSETGYNQIEDRGHNELVQKQFGARHIPTLALTDADGLPYAIAQPRNATVKGFSNDLAAWKQQRAERDQLFAQTATDDDSKKLKASAVACEWLVKRGLSRYYHQRVDSWLKLAEAIDPANQNGLHEAIFQAHWLNALVGDGTVTFEHLRQVARSLQDWDDEREFRNPDRAAGMYLLAAGIMLQTKDENAAADLVSSGKKYAPRDEKLRNEFNRLAALVENRNELGTGTGFAIASGGYILTNHHVIQHGTRFVVRQPGRQEDVPAEVLARDAKRDLALLKISGPVADDLVPIPVVAEELSRGSRIAVFGFPLGTIVGAGI